MLLCKNIKKQKRIHLFYYHRINCSISSTGRKRAMLMPWHICSGVWFWWQNLSKWVWIQLRKKVQHRFDHCEKRQMRRRASNGYGRARTLHMPHELQSSMWIRRYNLPKWVFIRLRTEIRYQLDNSERRRMLRRSIIRTTIKIPLNIFKCIIIYIYRNMKIIINLHAG